MDQKQKTELTADIVASFVGNNSVPPDALPDLIKSIYGSLSTIAGGVVPEPMKPQEPAVPVKRSISDDYLICLEDGRKLKSLKRHLSTKYGLTPDAYRKKWGLDKSYPMVAPSYARARSELAKVMGLGSGGRSGRPAKAAEAVAEETKKRGRKPKAAS